MDVLKSRHDSNKNQSDKATESLHKETGSNVTKTPASEAFLDPEILEQSSEESHKRDTYETMKKVGIGTSADTNLAIDNDSPEESNTCVLGKNVLETRKDTSENSSTTRNSRIAQCVNQKDGESQASLERLEDNSVIFSDIKLTDKITNNYENEDDLNPECHSLSSISEPVYSESLDDLEVKQRLLANEDIVQGDPIQSMLANAQIGKHIQEQRSVYSEETRRYTFRRIASLAPALESKPPSYMWLALFTILFNFVIGLIALVIAMQSDHEYWKENIPRAKKLGRVVKLMCILAISTTCLTIVVVSIVFSSPNKN